MPYENVVFTFLWNIDCERGAGGGLLNFRRHCAYSGHREPRPQQRTQVRPFQMEALYPILFRGHVINS